MRYKLQVVFLTSLLFQPQISLAYIQGTFDIGGKNNPIYIKEIRDPDSVQRNSNTEKQNSLKNIYGISNYYSCYSASESYCGLNSDMGNPYAESSCLRSIQYCLERNVMGLNSSKSNRQILTCADGYVKSSNNTCITYDRWCGDKYPNTIFTKFKDDGVNWECGCKTGFVWGDEKTGCTVVQNPQIKTNDEVCIDKFGAHIKWDGTRNSEGQLNCECESGYQASSNGKTCIATITDSELLHDGESGITTIPKTETKVVTPVIKKAVKIKETVSSTTNPNLTYLSKNATTSTETLKPRTLWSRFKSWFGF